MYSGWTTLCRNIVDLPAPDSTSRGNLGLLVGTEDTDRGPDDRAALHRTETERRVQRDIDE
jgi:hypothetical protein